MLRSIRCNSVMPSNANRAYGSNSFLLWFEGLRDRLAGNRARANARWGRVRPPAGSGKVIWIKTGDSPVAVRLATEVLAAIRHKRLDVRLVLSYEKEYPDILTAGLKGLQKIGFGYGPCDAPRAVRRVLARLEPLGVVFVGDPPERHLSAALKDGGIHSAYFAARQTSAATLEAIYPAGQDIAADCVRHHCAGYIAPPADPVTIITQAQVEPSFGGLVRGGAESALWWLHQPEPAVVRILPELSQRPDLGEGVLILSFENSANCDAAETQLRSMGKRVMRLSRWQREAVMPGTVLLADEDRWLPAIAASVNGAHLCRVEPRVLWQALAGGAPVSVADGQVADEGLVAVSTNEVFELWAGYRREPFRARSIGDAGRKRFWDERRRATAAVENLLQRVYDW